MKEIKHIKMKNQFDINTLKSHLGENRHSIFLKRLEKECENLDNLNIDYTLSFQPICEVSFHKPILLQFSFIYQEYTFYFFIPETYPFERPIFKIDKKSDFEKKDNVEYVLQSSSIHFLHDFISEFTQSTNKSDLICIKDFIEKYYVKEKGQKDDDIDPIRVYHQKFGNYFSPNLLLSDYYHLMCEGIDLAIGTVKN